MALSDSSQRGDCARHVRAVADHRVVTTRIECAGYTLPETVILIVGDD